MLLSYLKVDFNDLKYGGPNAPDWFGNDKQKLGFDFPNLPYVIDGENKITEGFAILKYICHKFGRSDMVGKTW